MAKMITMGLQIAALPFSLLFESRLVANGRLAEDAEST